MNTAVSRQQIKQILANGLARDHALHLSAFVVQQTLLVHEIHKPIPKVTVDVALQPAAALLLDANDLTGTDRRGTSVRIVPALPGICTSALSRDASTRAPIPTSMIGTSTATVFGDMAKVVCDNGVPTGPLFLGPVPPAASVVCLGRRAHRAHHCTGPAWADGCWTRASNVCLHADMPSAIGT